MLTKVFAKPWASIQFETVERVALEVSSPQSMAVTEHPGVSIY